jgi:hypothetical protein
MRLKLIASTLSARVRTRSAIDKSVGQQITNKPHWCRKWAPLLRMHSLHFLWTVHIHALKFLFGKGKRWSLFKADADFFHLTLWFGSSLSIKDLVCLHLHTTIWIVFYLDMDTRFSGSRGTVVGIATDYGLDGGGIGVRVPVGSRIFSSPSCADRLWGPSNLLSNGYRGIFPQV